MTVDFPSAMLVAPWSTQKSAIEKEKATADKLGKPAAKLLDALKSLNGSYAGARASLSLFETKGVASGADAATALGKLDAATKGDLKSLRGDAKLAEGAADEFLAALQRIRKELTGGAGKIGNDAFAAAGAVSKGAAAFESKLGQAIDATRKELDAVVARAKKAKPGAPGTAPAKPGKLNKQQILIKTRFLTAIKLAKKPPPNLKLKFLIAVSKVKSKATGRLTALAFVAKNAGAAQEKLLRSMIPKAEGIQCFRPKDGVVLWEKNALTFVTDLALPKSAIKALSMTMKKIYKVPVALRLRNTKGQALAEEEGQDIPDSELDAGVPQKQAAKDGKALEGRLDKLKPDIEAAAKRASSDPELARDLKEIVDLVRQSLRDKDFEGAEEAMEDLEAMLDETPAEEGEADEAAPAPTSAAAAPAPEALKQARAGWESARQETVKLIKELQQRIRDDFKADEGQRKELTTALTDLQKVITELEKGALTKKLSQKIDTAVAEKDAAKRANLAAEVKSAADEMVAFIRSDRILKELDGNELIPRPVAAAMQRELGRFTA